MKNQRTRENPGRSAALTDRVAHDDARLQIKHSLSFMPCRTRMHSNRPRPGLSPWTGWQKAVNKQQRIKVHSHPEGRPGPFGALFAALD